MWYREGTITFTQGSDMLSGSGTFWNVTANGVLPGMIVIGPDNKLYEIGRIFTDTSLQLVEPYAGETQTEVPCVIITTYEGDLTQFSARFTALMNRMSGDSTVMRSWLTSIDEITLEAPDGTELTVKSLPQIVKEHNENQQWYRDHVDTIESESSKALDAAARSESAAAAALNYKTAAAASESNALASKEAAENSQSESERHANEALLYRNDTQAIKDSAIQETNAIKNEAVNARDDAQTAKIGADSAKYGAETARDEARQWAQQVNPENLLHKDQNLSDVPNKVEAKSNIGLGCFESLVRGDYSDSRMWNPPLSGYVFIDSNKVWGAYDSASGNRIALPVESGGTGALTLEDARKNLQVDRLHYAGTSETIVRSPNDDFYIYINKDNKNWGAWDWKAGPDGTGSNIPLPMGSGGTGRGDGNLWANPDRTVGVGMEGDSENKRLFMWRTPGDVAFGSWVHALEGQWYGANWYLGATRSGTSTIQDVRITVNDGENVGAAFLFQGAARGTFRPGRGIVTQPTFGGWGQENVGHEVPFYVDTASNNNNSWNPAISCGSISTGGYYLRAAFGTITSNAASWPRAVVKLLGDGRFHRAFEFDYGGGISTWGSVQSSSDDQTWTIGYNFAKNPTSDRDLKDNIKYTDGKESYDRVMQWLPSMFTYKGSDIQRYGFIAQDLMKIDSQYVKLVPGAPKFLDVMKYNEETGEEELDHQIEYDRYDDTLALDTNVMMADLGGAVVYMAHQADKMSAEIAELKAIVSTLLKSNISSTE